MKNAEDETKTVKLDRRTRLMIAAESGLDERTVGAALEGIRRPHPLVRRAIDEAVRKLGIAL